MVIGSSEAEASALKAGARSKERTRREERTRVLMDVTPYKEDAILMTGSIFVYPSPTWSEPHMGDT
jgi:hypothetical protein